MQRTIRFFVTCLFCLALPLWSGCGEGDNNAASPTTEQGGGNGGSTSNTAEDSGLTAEQKTYADEYIAKHGKEALAEFMDEEWDRNLDATEGGLLLKFVKYFVFKGSDIKAQHGSALYDAAYCGNADVVKYLVSQGADAKAKAPGGCTPLHAAAGSNRANFEVVRFLIEKGADVNAKWDDSTPLDEAKEYGHHLIVDLLESKGAKSGK